MLQFNSKKQKSKGFSLIELLVVVGIMGILAAVAIPAYNKYRKNAAIGAMASDASNIARATMACATVNPFSSCITKAGAGVDNVAGISAGLGKSPKICFEFSREISGIIYKQCVSVDTGKGTQSQTNSEPFCYDETTANDCATLSKVGLVQLVQKMQQTLNVLLMPIAQHLQQESQNVFLQPVEIVKLQTLPAFKPAMKLDFGPF